MWNHQLKQQSLSPCVFEQECVSRAHAKHPYNQQVLYALKPSPTLLWPLLKQKCEMNTRKRLRISARSWCKKHPEALKYTPANWRLQKQAHMLTSLQVLTLGGKTTTRLVRAAESGDHPSLGHRILSLFMLTELPKTLTYWSSPGIFILRDPGSETLSPFPVSPPLVAVETTGSWLKLTQM